MIQPVLFQRKALIQKGDERLDAWEIELEMTPAQPPLVTVPKPKPVPKPPWGPGMNTSPR
eukprot:5584712-Heterocapsa_arctica.AAC.1